MDNGQLFYESFILNKPLQKFITLYPIAGIGSNYS